MTSAPPTAAARRRAVRLWLLAVAALMVATLVVGGATRLTESGLSIVEWKPVTGVVPPLDEPAWQAEFEKYKAIPQYRERNAGMSLTEFKTIYWWEWSASDAGAPRRRGVSAAVPMLLMVRLGRAALARAVVDDFRPRRGARRSRLVDGRLRPGRPRQRVAIPLGLPPDARLRDLRARRVDRAGPRAAKTPISAPGRIRVGALALLALVIVQIYLGALVAGLRAGLIYDTWPLIDGGFIPEPSRLFFHTPLWRNFFENTLTVQFDHRMAAYALWLLAVLHAADVARTTRGGPALTAALALACAVTLQAALGIVTLIHQTPLALALMHQGMAIVVLTIAVVHAERLEWRAAPAPIGGAAMRGGERTT